MCAKNHGTVAYNTVLTVFSHMLFNVIFKILTFVYLVFLRQDSVQNITLGFLHVSLNVVHFPQNCHFFVVVFGFFGIFFCCH